MRGATRSDSTGKLRRWMRRQGLAFRLGECFLALSAASCGIEFLASWQPNANMFWIANGILLGYLLLAPRRNWPAYLAVGLAAISTRILFLPGRWQEFLLYGVLDIVEVLVAAQLLRPNTRVLPQFAERSYLIRFVLYAGVVAPAIASALYLLSYPLLGIAAPAHPFFSWIASDSPGIVVTTPAFLAVFQSRFREEVNWKKNWFYLVLLPAVSMATFVQSSVPLVFLIFPLLVLVVLRVGMGYASLFMLIATAIASWYTIRGSGPFAAVKRINPALPTLLLLLAVCGAMFMIYSVSVVLESQKATERRLTEIARIHNLIVDNSRDLIIVADFSGNRQIVSSAVEGMTGWTVEEFKKRRIFELVHPEDRARAIEAVEEVKKGRDSMLVVGRLEKSNGEYVWAESSLRPIRDAASGAPTGVLNVMRDITDRKLAEQKLQEAYKALEEVATTDALTGLANRWRFDQCMRDEWRRAMRDSRPLSLLLLDVDWFKSYNDTYGHPKGDICLQQFAEAATEVVARPGDLVARIGGEEFAVLLPGTDSEGAGMIARGICSALKRRGLEHRRNPSGVVTISAGCATQVPTLGAKWAALLEAADQALYMAKRSGRDRVCDGSAGSSVVA